MKGPLLGCDGAPNTGCAVEDIVPEFVAPNGLVGAPAPPLPNPLGCEAPPAPNPLIGCVGGWIGFAPKPFGCDCC